MTPHVSANLERLAAVIVSRARSRLAAILGVLLLPQYVVAQTLEPRAYSPAPIGTRFLLVAAAESTGGVAVDASVPLENVEATVDGLGIGYGVTFPFFGQSASAALLIPYVDAEFSGDVQETFRKVTREGLGDLSLRLTCGLIGAPALTPAEFAARAPRPALSAGLFIAAPTGEYFPDKLINIGANRWSFKPELGLTWPLGHWYLELTGGAWFFTDNDDFFGGRVRKQEPLATIQTNVSYTFRPRLWVSAGWTYYTGGRTTVDSRRNVDWQDNNRYGVTVSFPVSKRQSLKFNWSSGATTRIGNDFDTFGLAWQFVWF